MLLSHVVTSFLSNKKLLITLGYKSYYCYYMNFDSLRHVSLINGQIFKDNYYFVHLIMTKIPELKLKVNLKNLTLMINASKDHNSEARVSNTFY